MVPIALKVGELYATMRLDDGQFTRGLDGSKSKFEGLKNAVGSGVKVMATAFAATTTAVAGLGIAALRVGLDYNRMQQTSRAALTTLLGSAEAANAQMDKLDEFARTSPFAKQVFIQAQQQLIGFGMAAEDVLPTLDAIQNAVAAVGGSNDDISEITRILATVTSSGKITAETLNQLGVRGVDAATLIGEQMGKTGQEIRDSITNGSLDAGEAVKLLTDGMMARFGGATANIKQQMDGAADRVKGAFRDIGSALAAPFIDPHGGGYLVVWTNDVADGMRNFEAKLRPLVDLLVGRFTPGLQAVSPVIQSVSGAINAWDLSKVNRQLDELGRYTPVIAGVATAMFSLGTQSIPIIGAINPVVAGFAALAATSPEVRAMFADAARSVQPLLPMMGTLAVQAADVAMVVIRELAPALGELLSAGGDVAVALGGALIPALGNLLVAGTPLVGLLADIVGWVADLPTPLLTAVAAFALLQGPLRPIADGLAGVATGMLRIVQQAQVQAALGGTNLAMGGLASSAMRAAPAVAAVGTALKAAFLTNAVGLAITGLVAALASFAAAAQEAKQRAAEYEQTLDGLGNATEQTTDRILAAIFEVESANWLEAIFGNQRSIMERAEAFGVGVDTLVRYIQGEEEAYREVTAAIDAYIDANSDSRREKKSAETAGREFVGMLDRERDALADAEGTARDKADANRELGRSERDAAGAADEHRLAQQALQDELNEGIDASLSAAEADLRYRQSMESTEEALRRKSEAEAELTAVMADANATTEQQEAAQRNVERATLSVEQALLSEVRALENDLGAKARNNATTGELITRAQTARDRFIALATQFGYSADEAAKMADEFGLIPTDIVTRFSLTGVDTALSRLGVLDATLNSINGKVVTATVAVKQYGQAGIATGGYVGHVAQGLAGGGAPWPRQRSGLVHGPGGPTDDLVNVRLSPTEFVLNSWATKLAGIGNLYALNAGKASIVPHLAGGGRPFEVTAPSYAPQPAPAYMTMASAQAPGLTVHAPITAVGADANKVASEILWHVRSYGRGGGRR